MNDESAESRETTFMEAHPWLFPQRTDQEEESVEEVIRYTLDEIRFG